MTASSRHPSRPYLGELEFTCTCHVDVKNEKPSLRSGLKNTSLGPRPLVYFGVGVGERKFSGTRKSHYHNETTTGRRHRDAYPFITPVECCHSATCTCTRHTAVLLQEKLPQVHALYLIHLHEYVRVCGYGTSDASEPQSLSSGPISYQHLVPPRGNTKTSSFVCMCTALYYTYHSTRYSQQVGQHTVSKMMRFRNT